eukprot:TRINITY_DN23651_c0_g1_i1.p2 TRINITY_DN23651_c0_g1~~TRINITY_DN23651_c0_g1_i1.p2  ORF type:complete len:137 (+),score=24.68 TRINITY_DN23651_c0_g1_i1:273-683(+)
MAVARRGPRGEKGSGTEQFREREMVILVVCWLVIATRPRRRRWCQRKLAVRKMQWYKAVPVKTTTSLNKCDTECHICVDDGVVYKAQAYSTSYVEKAEGENGENPEKGKAGTDKDGAVFELKVDGAMYEGAREEML